jgi:hypothetical protein
VVVIDSTHVHTGTKALQLAVPVADAPRAFAVLKGSTVFPAPVHEHYGRMWIWISAVQGATGYFTHIDNIEATGTIDGTPSTAFERVRYGAGLQPNSSQPTLYGDLTNDGSIDAAVNQDPQVPVPLETWSCYEWHFGGPAVEGNFWLNGTVVTGLTPPGYGWDPSWQFPLIDSVSIGWQAWGHLVVPVTVWIDDVAVGTSRLGCQ